MRNPDQNFIGFEITRKQIANRLNGYADETIAPDDDRLADDVCQGFAITAAGFVDPEEEGYDALCLETLKQMGISGSA